MKYYTAEESAKKLKISTGHIYELVKRGELKKKEGLGRTIRIPASELQNISVGRKYFIYDKAKVEVIDTHLGEVRKVKFKDEYVLTDIVKAVGLKDTYSIVRRLDDKFFKKIECVTAQALGLFANKFGLILISHKGIEQYCNKSRSTLNLKRFLDELNPVEKVKVQEQLSIDGPKEGVRSDIQIFSNSEFGQVRTFVKQEQPWFIGKDVAEKLGYSNTRDALKIHVDEEDKANVAIHDGSQNRKMVIINESGLYSLIFGSKLPKAKEFKRWVTNEVLPTIHKTGGYINNSEKFVGNYFSTFSPEMRQAMLKDLDNKNKELFTQKDLVDKALTDNIKVIKQIRETL